MLAVQAVAQIKTGLLVLILCLVALHLMAVVLVVVLTAASQQMAATAALAAAVEVLVVITVVEARHLLDRATMAVLVLV